MAAGHQRERCKASKVRSRRDGQGGRAGADGAGRCGGPSQQTFINDGRWRTRPQYPRDRPPPARRARPAPMELDDLARHTGVSKAMLSKLWTAARPAPDGALLGRISGALGLPPGSLADRGRRRRRPAGGRPSSRARDPQTGYVRRQVSPLTDPPVQLVGGGPAAGPGGVASPAPAYTFIRQLIWVPGTGGWSSRRVVSVTGWRRATARAGPAQRLRPTTRGRAGPPLPGGGPGAEAGRHRPGRRPG